MLDDRILALQALDCAGAGELGSLQDAGASYELLAGELDPLRVCVGMPKTLADLASLEVNFSLRAI